MDVAELRAVYTAVSTDFDRVTDHVQKRLKETQGLASGAGKSTQSQTVAKEAASAQSSILKTIEQGRQAFVKSQVDAAEKDVAATVASTKAAVEVERQATNVRMGFLKTIEAGRQEFVTSQIKAAETEAKGIVGAVQKEAAERQRITQEINQAFAAREAEQLAFQTRTLKQAEAAWVNSERVKLAASKDAEKEGERLLAASNQARMAAAKEAEVAASKFNPAAFWARQQAGAQTANKAVVIGAKQTADAEIAEAARWASDAAEREAFIAERKAARALKGVAVTTAAATTEKAAAKSVAQEVEQSSGRVLSALTNLFVRNNFLFRQLGQRAAGDLGFAAVGVTKLAVNLNELIARQGGALASQALLNTAFLRFQRIIASVAQGRNKGAGDIFGVFGIDALQGLRAPEAAFSKFLARFRGIQNEADRAALAVTVFGKDAIKLLPVLESAATGSAAMAGGLDSAATSAVGALGAFGPLGIAVAVAAEGFIAVEVAATAAAAGLFFVAKSVSDTEEHFADLNRQTGLSTDNLQVLDIVSRQSGTTLDRLNNSVGQLQRKLIDASEGGTSRLSVGLKKLGIDAEDPNKALNQLIDLLDKLPAGTVRTGAAMQIFGRGGRDVAGVIGEIADQVGSADGALDRLKKQLRDAGVHINSDGVETAANFHKQLVLLEAQFESVKRVIGEEALPTVLRIATRFSDWVGRNRVEVEEWAKHIEHAAEALVRVGIALANLAKFSTGIFIPIIPIIRAVAPEAVEIAQGVGAAVSGQPTLPGSRFSPVTRGRAQQGPSGTTTLTPGFLQRQLAIGQPVTPASFASSFGSPFAPSAGSEADRIAKKIREAFGPTGKAGKGEDPAQTARRLAEITLQETLKGLEAEHEALQRSLDLNLISRDKYTQDAINLELKRRQVTIEGLKKELDEAEKIRKPGQRAIRVAEINARIRDEERRSATEVQKITDESAAQQLRIGRSLAESHLRIVETQTEQLKARARDYADFREITEAEAARVEEQQSLRVFGVRRGILEQELREAGENVEKQTEAHNKLNELEAERVAFIEESERRIEAARRRDAEHVVQFAAQIRDAFQRAADVQLEAGEANLEPLRNSILTRHQLWDAELQFEIQREQRRHDSATKDLQDEEVLARIRIKNAQELARTLEGIHAQEAAEENLHQARLKQLATQAAEQRRQELLRVADDLSDIASQIFDAIGKSSTEFWAALRNTASNFAKQIRDELFKGLLEKAITGQAQGAEGLIGAIINPLLGAKGPNAAVSDNTKATRDNTAAVNALTQTMGGTPPISTAGGLSGVLQFIPGLLGGSRASGGPVEAGRVYRVHENEVFFRPNLNGQIVNLDKAGGLLGSQRDEVRLNVAVGQDAVDDLVESHMLTPKGRRAALVRAKYNRKVGKLLFA